MPAPVPAAVLLSYASQDAEAVERIAGALRAAGIEVWFDRSELVGGDAWDAKIRKQIAECALFAPIISAATQARGEGYFRLEWKLAVDRSHLMAHDQPFLLPLVIDDTMDAAARVPPEFRAVQWTRLPGGETPERFCARVKALLAGSVMEPGRPRPGERGEGAASPAESPCRCSRSIPPGTTCAKTPRSRRSSPIRRTARRIERLLQLPLVAHEAHRFAPAGKAGGKRREFHILPRRHRPRRWRGFGWAAFRRRDQLALLGLTEASHRWT